jgi:hypothetical protein
VQGARIELGELTERAPESARDLDLGPAPPPGATLLLDHRAVAAALREAGLDPASVRLDSVLRVVGASRRWTPDELVSLARPAVESSLPDGVVVTHMTVRSGIVTAPGATAGRPEIPKTPRRAGATKTAVVVPLLVEGEVVARVTLSTTLDVSERAARPDVLRGARVTLFIDRRAARIGAAGFALEDLDVGEVGTFRVDRTGRTVRARLESTDLASVISP